MKFNVVKNRIARLDSEMLTTKNVNSIECSFTFSDDYSGLDLYAVFYRDENTNCFVELSDGQCILPHEMLEDGGTLCVGAYGVKNTSDTVEKRITTNCVKIQIYPSLSSSASPSAAPTPDMWEQYKQEILAYKAEAETARAGAQEAKKEAETAKDTAISNADIASEKAAVATQMAENAYSSAREASESAQLVAPVVEDVNQLKSDLSLISGKMVQSVNNQKPDENGNVTVEAGSGGGDIALGITGATVGQIAKITAVDDAGKPTAWEAADFASDWKLFQSGTTGEDVAGFEFEGISDYSEFLLLESLNKGADNGGLCIKMNDTNVLTVGTYFVHSSQAKNVSVQIVLMPQKRFSLIAMSQQQGSTIYNIDKLGDQSIYNIPSGVVEPIEKIGFFSSNSNAPVPAGATYALYVR